MISSYTAILLSVTDFNENYRIVSFLTSCGTYFKSLARFKKKEVSLVPANLLSVDHYNRNGALGKVGYELIASYGTNAIVSIKQSILVSYVLNTLNKIFKDTISDSKYASLFQHILFFLEKINDKNEKYNNLCAITILTCSYILEKAGYGFSLDKCNATGSTDISQLYYLSPRTGHAVSKASGEPYKDKLFILPKFMVALDKNNITRSDIINGSKIIDHFVSRIDNDKIYENYASKINLQSIIKRFCDE